MPGPKLAGHVLAVSLGLGACAKPVETADAVEPSPPEPAPADHTGQVSRADDLGRVANYDPRGVGGQPDYNHEAARLRAMVLPHMPEPMPTDPRRACQEMLVAADRFYRTIERGNPGSPPAAAQLRATRKQDLEACIRDTSPAAATCVAILLAESNTEAPWLIDQCSRAFPKDS